MVEDRQNHLQLWMMRCKWAQKIQAKSEIDVVDSHRQLRSLGSCRKDNGRKKGMNV